MDPLNTFAALPLCAATTVALLRLVDGPEVAAKDAPQPHFARRPPIF
jgi:hypothetical protein